jgi:lipoprotein NlpI
VIGALLVYGGSYGNPLLFDDNFIINPVRLQKYLSSTPIFRMRWLSYSTFGLNYLLSGTDVYWYRVINVLLHGSVGFACFLFLQRLLHAAVPGANAGGAQSIAAFCAASIFVLNPVSVYAVGYVVQRSIVMATLFAILALHAFTLGLERDDQRWLWASVGAYGLAAWSKEHAVMVPAAIVSLTLSLRPVSPALVRRLLWPLLGFATVGMLVILRMQWILGASYEPYVSEFFPPLPFDPAGTNSHAFGSSSAIVAPSTILATGIYLRSVATQAGLFFRYLLLWLMPYPGWMSGDIRVPIVPSLTHWTAITDLVAFVGWGAGSFALVVRRGMVGMVGLVLIVPWLLFFTEFAATRIEEPFVLYRSYLWMIGLPIVLSVGALRLSPKLLATIAVALGLALLGGTRERLDSFSTPLKFWDDVVRKNAGHTMPFVSRGLSNRAVALMHLGRFREALADLDEAIQLDPRDAHAWINRANIRSHHSELSSALADADEALRRDPLFGAGYAERCAMRMKPGMDVEAIEDCSKALRLIPSYQLALLNRGALLARRGRLDEAIADFDGILKYDPHNALALYNRGMALAEIGRHDESRASLREACGLGIAPACEPASR